MMTKHPQFSEPLPDGRLLCTLCPRECQLADEQRGLCFVRKREGDKIELTTYGRSSGFVIDPIEKKPLNHFYPGSSVLSFGTAGCNLSCKFCQNWDMSKSREMDILQSPATPEAIARAARDHECHSVAFTYNDPVIFYEYAVDTAIACHELDINTVAVTAGYINDTAREGFFQCMDAVNVDLKGFSESFYHEFCTGSLQPVLDTLEYLVSETQVWTEITTLLIPGENDSENELDAMTRWIAEHLGPDVPLHFSAFHPDYKLMTHPPTTHQSLLKAKRIALKNGLNYVYLGNVHDPENASTICPACGETVISRVGYTITEWHLNAKRNCVSCGQTLPGIFEPVHGTWGNRYQRIQL
ncbi:MAG: AmmeMemoRadiSam system radical SAM enzyme [Candidatus Marinimicrobia bacterium]|jgi:pyruvate formate lyase activating enzyme|nr:AmmeMemoRadiSam system radical SAM enzyme [Candidatus Neomarinimicrobiota bacterium]MBT4359440.1 AmmeMemoRadiSam system radical SAM enzyme [Candidatus Neomarinimicrobiota bacterium]MBT4715970.1 AmmeMemoRadiSam system radical SAM enzyme [Candidatus Neomarinimicrobiota bacterium]MBT4948097.1 AmmeMemoRadiSam system radical SAM enzyme [Candidatus Neomarinimicrobiota bacterium]MBT5270979.1 AmmeMemoRadiSam system radical SAM enzyme [Candidatus Neomarinimicrobiota bacterium]